MSLWSAVPVHGEDLTTQATFTVREGETVEFLLMWHPSHEGAERHVPPMRALEETLRVVGAMERSVHLRRRVARRSAAFPDRAQSPDLRAHRRHRRRRNHLSARTAWRGPQLGLPYLLAARRDVHALLAPRLRVHDRGDFVAGWLLRAVAGDPAEMQTMYGPSGERRLTELTLDWLPGYEQSRPVRIGNAAVNQLQLDVYGEVMDTLYVALRAGVEPDAQAWAIQRLLIEFLESAWKEPDEGIWEVRGPRRHFTHSKVMAWVAVDRAIKMATNYGFDGPVGSLDGASRRDPRRRLRRTASTRSATRSPSTTAAPSSTRAC